MTHARYTIEGGSAGKARLNVLSAVMQTDHDHAAASGRRDGRRLLH
jgi:hypothetical protein